MSNSVKDKKILDVKNDNVAYTKCVQGEVNSRFLQVIFKDESQSYNLTGCFVTMYMPKSDNTIIFVDGTIMDAVNGTVLFPLTEQMSSVLGSFNIIFKIYSTDPVSELKVKGLVLEVEEGNIDNAIVSSNDFTALQSALSDVGNMNAHMANMNNPHGVSPTQIGAATVAQGIKADNALPSSEYTASDILTKLKTVDGSESGLDADTLDGLNSTSFIQTTEKGAANGVAMLNASNKLVQMPTAADVGALSTSVIRSGTWTPYMGSFGTTDGAVTYTTQAGTWYWIGNLVYIYLDLATSYMNAWTGNVGIFGLPFKVKPGINVTGDILNVSGITYTGHLAIRTINAYNYALTLRVINNGVTTSQLPYSAISGSGFTINGAWLIYQTDDA